MNKCIGCGITLQNKDKSKDGYISNEIHNLCQRCFIIKNYGQNKSITKNNIDYMKILNNINDNDLVVYISSLLTLNLDYINKFKNTILVLTKRDILPKSIKDIKIINYIKNKYNNILDIEIVSAYKKYNLDNLYNKLNKYTDKKIYFVGITNSGKSTLINEMIKSYNKEEGNITTSNYPSTTLDTLNIKVGNLNIIDTPGIVINNSIINYLDNKNIKMINSKKEIKPKTYQINGIGSILISNLFRIDYECINSSLTFYLSNNINISQISLSNPRIKLDNYEEIIIDNNKDLVIEDIGFIKITNKVKIKLYCNNNIKYTIRDNLI